jgi:FkbM family methyltransferase
MTFVSYAQCREDVVLNRALHYVSHEVGFYIDAGACHPSHDSVTKHFYDHGWHGVNIEPSRRAVDWFRQERPRDINLQVAISDQPGEVTFHDLDNGQLSTVVDRFADRHERDSGYGRSSYTVPTMTLTQICEQYAPAEIHFLKIDIEGAEAAAVRGMDFTRFRPWVLCIEATEPMKVEIPTYQEWESDVLAAGYQFVQTDGLNRFYVAHERGYLGPLFATRADDYIHSRYINRIRELEEELSEVRRRMAEA